MALSIYRKKRDFKHTKEPRGSTTKHSKKKYQKKLIFVIQKHNARRLHYDFRLEINGTLKSWAVPKGPSLDPSIKRLAVEVEDHPMEYAHFEGVIPEKHYGAGVVMIWDKGVWTCDEDPYQSYKKGDIHITLEGNKLQGSWHLIKIKSPQFSTSKNAWLLIKSKDKYANTHIDVLKKYPLSVFSNLTTNEIKKKAEAPNGDAELNSVPLKDSKGKPDKKSKSLKLNNLKGAKKKNMPKKLSPELCTLVNKTPTGKDWIHEIKYDGYRLICFITPNKIRFLTRRGKDWTEYFQPLSKNIKKLKLHNSILDGEVVVLDKKGNMSFQELQSTLKGESKSPLQYYIFDIPYYNGYDLSLVPLLKRKEILKNIFPNKTNQIKLAEFMQGNGPEIFKEACEHSLEGLISKKINSPYEQVRSHQWVKSKCENRQEFVIGGFTKPKGTRKGFGALLLGYYNDQQKLIYCGKVGTGYTRELLSELYEKFKKNTRNTTPFESTNKIEKQKEVTWLQPKFVAEIKFSEFTHDNILRQPVFMGLRKDKEGKEVRKEYKKSSHEDTLSLSGVSISHATKLLYPSAKITKQNLAEYYENISDLILPYITNRPLSILRCPEGVDKECFFQKHFLKSFSDTFYHIKIKGDKQDYFYIKNKQGLLNLVQLGVLEIHPWGSRIDNIEKPDIIIFDLDPAPDVAWNLLIAAAYFIKEQLDALELQSFVKTTGGKGLHIVIPIMRKLEWAGVKEFAHKFALSICKLQPEYFICKMTKSERKGKIFIDYLRNGRGATAVAPYSTRARENAPISTPLRWEELKKLKSADQYTLSNIMKRIKKIKDPWEGFFDVRQSIKRQSWPDV